MCHVLIRINALVAKLSLSIFLSEDKDEPFAFEAREFLRKKLIGKEVKFMSKAFPSANPSGNSTDRERGKIFYPDENDIAEEIVANGWADVKKPGGKAAQDPDIKRLTELEEKARKEEKGKFRKDRSKVLLCIDFFLIIWVIPRET